jgi:hypothetical protein
VRSACLHDFRRIPIVLASRCFSYQILGVIHSLVCAGADVLLADMTLPWSHHACSVRRKVSAFLPCPICFIILQSHYASGAPASAPLH